MTTQRGAYINYRLFDHRDDADYQDFVTFEAAEVAGWLERAAAFVGGVGTLAEKQLRKDTEAPSE